MNDFQNKINQIKMNDQDKQRILNNILNYKYEKQKNNKGILINNFISRFVAFIAGIALLSSTAYATIKVLNFDTKISKYFDKDSETIEKLGVTTEEISKIKETDYATFTINQIILDEKEMYISLDIDGKDDAIYLTGIETYDTNNYCFGFALLEEDEKHTGYLLESSINNPIKENTKTTIKLKLDNDKKEELTINIPSDNSRVKEINPNAVVYNKDGIVATIKNIRFTPMHMIFDIKYNVDLNTLDEVTLEKIQIELYNVDVNRDTYVTFEDGTTYVVRLWYEHEKGMLQPYLGYDKLERIVNVDQIKSITINGVEIPVKNANIGSPKNDLGEKQNSNEVTINETNKNQPLQNTEIKDVSENLEINTITNNSINTETIEIAKENNSIISQTDYGEPLPMEAKAVLKNGYLYYSKNENEEFKKINGTSNIKELYIFNIGSGINKVPFVVTEDGTIYRLNSEERLVKYEELSNYKVKKIIKHEGELYDIFTLLLNDGSTKIVEIKA